MEVSGKKQNKHNEALTYCENCKIHLCGGCGQTHRTARTSSFNIVNSSPSVGAKDPLPTCPEHEKETVKFYCGQHDMIGCVACMISHKECKTAYIPNISEQFLKSEEFFQYKVFSEELKTRFADSMRKTEENTSIVDIACRQALDVVQNIKKEFIDSLEKFEIELRDEVMSFKNANEDKLMNIKSELDQLHKTNLETEALIATLEKENKCNALFFEAKRAEKYMVDCQERLYEISTRNKVKTMLFLPSKDLESLMNKEKIFGIIDIIDLKADSFNTLEYFEKQHIGTVNIHSKEDKKPCYAAGLAFLSNDILAVADKMNQNVKLVDVNQDNIVSEITDVIHKLRMILGYLIVLLSLFKLLNFLLKDVMTLLFEDIPQHFYSKTLRFPLLITSDGPSGRLYDGQFFKPFGTELP
ncbi:uncharacterized protein LOC132729158 [Ruditapes philippinarum]|uniref:uncharacterized protein LOC132729158 n=1 Tax=Ruditapes philippinarum TaxID=129788 RepID=UPI00295AC367|nr:uncharacterized protein LOC132729158 [Ruditapes philippinarum]